MKLSVFVGNSLDGFIARRNGQYDFLPAGGGEPHGYDEFIASVDTILIGRNTFEVVLKLPRWPYGNKRVVVLSHRPLDFAGTTARVEQKSGDPAQIAHELAATGAKHVYVDGGIAVQEFLQAGQIHHITITILASVDGTSKSTDPTCAAATLTRDEEAMRFTLQRNSLNTGQCCAPLDCSRVWEHWQIKRLIQYGSSSEARQWFEPLPG
jgi:dihydrofolate reductase